MNGDRSTPSALFGFLRRKLQGVGIRSILHIEVEGWLLWLFGSFPGMVGFSLRTVVLKLLCAKLGGFAWVQPRVTFVHTDRLRIGRMFGVNSGSYINAVGTVTVGDYVLIGSNVTISSGRHPIEGESPAVFARPAEPLPIVIEDDVWIGAGAVILPGVTLRCGTVVGANAVVTKTTEPYAVVVGAPARKLRSRVAKA